MAVMDTLTSNNTQATKEGTLPLQQPPPSGGQAKTSIKKENIFHHPSSPYLEKGSGQERFRQMLSGIPGYTDSSSTAFMPPIPANTQQRGHFQPAPGPIYSPMFPGFHPDMYSDVPAGEHRAAVSSITYPTAANTVRPISQALAPLPNGGGTRGNKGRDHVHDRHNGGKGGRATTHSAGTLTQPWTSILSAECQKRRFNPQFNEWINPDGTHQCTVNLNGQVLNDSRCWNSAVDAKQALSRRAVEYIRKQPLPDGSYNKSAENSKVRGSSSRPREKNHQPVAGAEDDERRLLQRIQSLYGYSGGPSQSIMANPAASRAFLEGFALGSKLRDSRDQRRRSRSPLRGRRNDQRGPHDGFVKRE